MFPGGGDLLQLHQQLQPRHGAGAAGGQAKNSHEADPLCFQVVEIYSEYINNFSRAMELVRLEAKRRSAFADFLNKKRLESSDRLNLFGLMVKPIQRWASSLFSVIFSFSVPSHQRGWASFYFPFRVRHIYSLSSRVCSFFCPLQRRAFPSVPLGVFTVLFLQRWPSRGSNSGFQRILKFFPRRSDNTPKVFFFSLSENTPKVFDHIRRMRQKASSVHGDYGGFRVVLFTQKYLSVHGELF